MANTLQPSTNSELQLYRVLQRANLLQYFDTFITQGGDDVQQLCEAGEEEFLEIMALVGMASKPLHVRRLQKALQEWVANPTAFDVPKRFPTVVMSMAGGGGNGRPGSTPSPMSSTEASLSPGHSMPTSLADVHQQQQQQQQNQLTSSNNNNSSSNNTITNNSNSSNINGNRSSCLTVTPHASTNTSSNHSGEGVGGSGGGGGGGGVSGHTVLDTSKGLSGFSTAQTSNQRTSPCPSVSHAATSLGSEQSPPWALQTRGPTPPEATSSSGGRRGHPKGQGNNVAMMMTLEPAHPSPPDSPQDFKDVIKDGVYNPHDAAYIPSVSHPVLMEHQISAIAAAAAILARDLPPIEPKSLPKKQNSKDINTVMMMNPDDPNRLDAMRKYAAIYGRFDSKRKNHRPMSLHEISVNEAAAQLCNHFPALLTRREELFPLARQVVRDSGYQYSKGHSRAAEVLVQPKLEPTEQTGGGPLGLGVPHQQQQQTAPNLPAFVSVSAGGVSPEEEAYNELQTELNHITLHLSEMDKEQGRIRAALRVLLEANDLDQMRGLTAEMDVLNDRQEALAKRRHRIVATLARYKKGGPKLMGGCDKINIPYKQYSGKNGNRKNFNNNNISNNNNNHNNNNNNKLPSTNSMQQGVYGCTSSPLNLNNSSGSSSINGRGAYSGGGTSTTTITNKINNLNSNMAANTTSGGGGSGGGAADTDVALGPSNPLNTLYMAALHNQRDSLFEEGLRIATQYGMSDFARELIGMKSQVKVPGSDDSGISLGVAATSGGPLPQSSSSSSSAVVPVSSSLFTSSISSSSSSSTSSTSSPSAVAASSMAAVVSSDNISASSPEYLAPASGCRLHTPPAATTSLPPSLMTASSSSSSSSPSSSSSSPPSSSSASLLFPSSVCVIKPAKSPKIHKRSAENSACPTSLPVSTPSAKSPKLLLSDECTAAVSSTMVSPCSQPTTISAASYATSSSSASSSSSVTATTNRTLMSSKQEADTTIAQPTVATRTTAAAAATAAALAASTEPQGSTTTTTTITTKSGQVIEVETRRSSRRKNGEPDYYLINGGEKRFRTASNSSGPGAGPAGSMPHAGVSSSPAARRGSSSQDRRKSSSSDGTSSISSPSKPYTLDPCNSTIINNNNNSSNNNNSNNNNSNKKDGADGDNVSLRIDVNEMRFRNPAGEIHKVRMGFQQRIEPSDRDKR